MLPLIKNLSLFAARQCGLKRCRRVARAAFVSLPWLGWLDAGKVPEILAASDTSGHSASLTRCPLECGHPSQARSCSLWARSRSQPATILKPASLPQLGPPNPPTPHCLSRDNEKRLRRWLERSNSRRVARTSQISSACPSPDP